MTKIIQTLNNKICEISFKWVARRFRR